MTEPNPFAFGWWEPLYRVTNPSTGFWVCRCTECQRTQEVKLAPSQSYYSPCKACGHSDPSVNPSHDRERYRALKLSERPKYLRVRR